MAQTLPTRKTDSLVEELERMRNRILQRANEIFQADGSIFGKDLDNWLKAERELVWSPAMELEEKDNELRLQIAVPGVEAKDLDIEVTPEEILVKAETRHEHKGKEGDVYTCEFASGSLFRSVHLPKPVEADKVKAELVNGMLKLTAPIAQEARTRKVAITAA